ncbi:MAG: HEAT repeat domain-containing protein [Candidatus Eisenbacteria bacterium]
MATPDPSGPPRPGASARTTAPERDRTAAEDAHARQATAWLQLFARTLKTWRLYDEHNPMVTQFREQLHRALTELLEAHGTLTLSFTADTVSCAGVEIHRAHSRDDQLSMVFFRDGIHALTFAPGMAREELDVVLGHVVRMSVRAQEHEDDLVTLLWEAELPHLDMQYVSAEADFDLSSENPASDSPVRRGPPMAWPQGGTGTDEPANTSPSQPALSSGGASRTPAPVGGGTRSEDWTTSDPTGPLAEELEAIEAGAPLALRRFEEERNREQAESRSGAMLTLIDDALHCGLQPAEQHVFRPTVIEIVQDALGAGRWEDTARALPVLRACHAGTDEMELWAGLARADSLLTRTVIRMLDSQNQQEVARFFELARAAGPLSLDWLILILAESQQQRVRRPLARTIAEIAGEHVGRITHWLTDKRWYLVRNLVMSLHAIGGESIVSPLAGVLAHPDRRVRLEVLGALGRVPPPLARPLLLRVLHTDDVRELSSALRLLATGPDPEVARHLLDRVLAEDFVERSPEEQRTVLSALGATGNDDMIPLLESLLDPAKRPGPGHEQLLPGIARCLVRLGTPGAVAALQRAMGSRWQSTREAASLALAAARPR